VTYFLQCTSKANANFNCFFVDKVAVAFVVIGDDDVVVVVTVFYL